MMKQSEFAARVDAMVNETSFDDVLSALQQLARNRLTITEVKIAAWLELESKLSDAVCIAARHDL